MTLTVDAAHWREAIAQRLAAGARFAGGWAVGSGTGAQWRVALRARTERSRC